MKKLLFIRYSFLFVLVLFCSLYFLNNLPLSFEGDNFGDSLCINEIMILNRNSFMDSNGEYEDWVEIYNKSGEPINMKGFGLTDDRNNLHKWVFPDVTIKGKSYLIVWASGKNRSGNIRDLHTNFKLKAADELVILSSPDGRWNDIVKFEKTSENTSYGRSSDGGEAFSAFDNGTPGSSNNEGIALRDGLAADKLDVPHFSLEGGVYSGAVYLTLSSAMEGVNIYYTMDGSVPTEKSVLYKEPIKIMPQDKKATIIRAISCKNGYKKSSIITHSYFVTNAYMKYDLPIVSLVSDPIDLFDYDRGILVKGKIYDNWVKNNAPNGINTRNIEANFTQRGRRWERGANLEIFESGKKIMNQGIGIRVFGGYSRVNPIKSLALFARYAYDDQDVFRINFAKDANQNNDIALSKLILRTPSTDHAGALFRDEMIQSLIPGFVQLDTQQSRTCIVFLNGEFYGIYNIKEPYDSKYFYNHYRVDYKDIVVLENPTGVAGIEVNEGFAGDEMHFNRMQAFITSNNMELETNYDYAMSMMDMSNFIEYNILQIYSVNRDWPGNNVKVWRKRTEKYEPDAPYGNDGRWRWLVFDMDYGFGLFNTNTGYEMDMINFATEAKGPVWPNPPWSTAILRALLENDEFKGQFINTFADRLNTIYKEEAVLRQIEFYRLLYYPYVEEHINRWGESGVNISSWEKQIDFMKEFAVKRPDYVRKHIVNYFHLPGLADVSLNVGIGGKVKINTLLIESSSSSWKGTYFKDLRITFQAIPEEGYVFEGWSGYMESKNSDISIELKDDINLKAAFSRGNSK